MIMYLKELNQNLKLYIANFKSNNLSGNKKSRRGFMQNIKWNKIWEGFVNPSCTFKEKIVYYPSNLCRNFNYRVNLHEIPITPPKLCKNNIIISVNAYIVK